MSSMRTSPGSSESFWTSFSRKLGMPSRSGSLLRLSHSARSSLRRARVRKFSRLASIHRRNSFQWRISASWLTSTERRPSNLSVTSRRASAAANVLTDRSHRFVARHVDSCPRVLAALAGRDEAHEQALGRRLLLGGKSCRRARSLAPPAPVRARNSFLSGRSVAPSVSPRLVRARIRAAAACRCRIRRSGRTRDRGRCRG